MYICTSSSFQIDSQETAEENEPRATPHEVVLPAAASKRSRKTKRKAGAPVSSNVEKEEQDTALPMANADAYAALVQMPRGLAWELAARRTQLLLQRRPQARGCCLGVVARTGVSGATMEEGISGSFVIIIDQP
jgi:hypothetical protein